MTSSIGKVLIITGLIIFGIGLLVYFKDSIPLAKYLGKLPGDIVIKKENFSFYFPLMTSILISVILSLLFMLFGKLR